MRVLIGDITSGALPAGATLPRETDLAAQFGVSRGVARESLRGLEERGLVTVKHGRGATVCEREGWDVFNPDVLTAVLEGDHGAEVLREYLECRRVLEIEAAGLAAERADANDLAALSGALERMSAAARRATGSAAAEDLYHEADVDFHRAVIAATGNQALSRMTEPIQRALNAARRPLARPEARQATGIPEHRRILTAIASGNAAGARARRWTRISGRSSATSPSTQAIGPRDTDRRRRMPDGDVLVTWPEYAVDGEATGRRLTAAGLSVRCVPKRGRRGAAEVADLVEGSVAAIVSTDPFDAEVFGRARGLKVVARVGVGTDSIDLVSATSTGVVVTVTPGANTATVAEHAVALILAAVRRIVEHDASVRRGEWARGGPLTPWELRGATVGLVGYGQIGRAVARRLSGFGVELLVCDLQSAGPAVEAPVRPVGLDELLRSADVVSLHVPLAAPTRGLIGVKELEAMRPEAILVNTSRGEVVDEPGLIERLRSGRLRAASLDVFADEPVVPRALLELPNVTLSPHVGGLSEPSIRRMTALATESVLKVLDGSIDPAYVANPDVLTRRKVGA